MELLNEETIMKIRMMNPEKQKQVIDGIAKIMAVRAHEHVDELQSFYQSESNNQHD